jgi:hypothetical protein
MPDMTIEKAFASNEFGFSVNFDGDRHLPIFGTHCNCCNTYFESEKIQVYCGGKYCKNHNKEE